MATHTQRILRELKAEFDNQYEIVSLLYNKDEEIEEGDNKKIRKVISDIKLKKAILILNGGGGVTDEGKKFALTFRSKFCKGFLTLVPEQACSALVFPILVSSCLIISEDSLVKPITPYFYYNGVYLSAVEYMYNKKDPKRQKKAIKHYGKTVDFCETLFKSPGSIIQSIDQLKISHLKSIVQSLFNKNKDYPIDFKKLKDMNFRTEVYERDHNFWKNILAYYKLKEIELLRDNTRFILETTSKSFTY